MFEGQLLYYYKKSTNYKTKEKFILYEPILIVRYVFSGHYVGIYNGKEKHVKVTDVLTEEELNINGWISKPQLGLLETYGY